MKQAKDNKAVPEIVIPKGYSIDEMLDLDDGGTKNRSARRR